MFFRLDFSKWFYRYLQRAALGKKGTIRVSRSIGLSRACSRGLYCFQPRGSTACLTCRQTMECLIMHPVRSHGGRLATACSHMEFIAPRRVWRIVAPLCIAVLRAFSRIAGYAVVKVLRRGNLHSEKNPFTVQPKKQGGDHPN